MKISYSRVSSYLSCQQKHHWNYVIGIVPKSTAKPLRFGSDFHKLLEGRILSEEQQKDIKEHLTVFFNELPANEQEELGENYLENLFQIFNDYQEHWKNEPLPNITEKAFEIEIGKLKGQSIYFHGIIDEVYNDSMMGEHKTFTNRPDLGLLQMNMQACLYSKAWEFESGNKFSQVQWDYIKSSPAEYPVYLEKSKRFSEASNQKITPQSYLRACKEYGFTDEETLSKALKYYSNIENFFFRYKVDLLPSMVDGVWNDFRDVVKEIVTKEKKIKNVSRDCSWCSYRPLCNAEFCGLDVDEIIEKDYKSKEER